MHKLLMSIITGCFMFVLNSQSMNIDKINPDTLSEDELAQYYEQLYLDSLMTFESKLKRLSDSILHSDSDENRLNAVREYIPVLVKALQVPGSIKYPFDSLEFMFTHMPPDSSFRLYNWLLEFDDGGIRYYGAIQMNSDTFKLYPLVDARHDLPDMPVDQIFTPNRWRGALYYDIVQTTSGDQTYYTLLGWDNYSERSQVKLLEVLTFDHNNKPEFGAPVFEVRDEEGRRQLQHRVFFEYSQDAYMALTVADGTNIIIFDHLIALGGTPDTKVPDGSYHAYVFKAGRWIHVQHPFDVLEEFQPED